MNSRAHQYTIQAALLPLLLSAATAFGQQVPNASALDPEKYELALLVKDLMIDKSPNTGFRGDHLYFKSFLLNIHLLTARELSTSSPESFPGNPDDYLYVYEGKMPVFVKGQRLLVENMEDRYLWSVHFAGPKAHVSTMYIRSEKPVFPRASAGASYFSSAGLKLDPLSCENFGGSDTNYAAYYKVSAPNKYPITLGISKSTGSGGIWYSYEISWYGVKAASLGKDAVIGVCDIAD